MGVNCRVTARELKLQGQTVQEREREKFLAFQGMLLAFKSKVHDCKIMNEVRRRQSYESPGEKKRRKRAESIRQKNKNKGVE